VRTVGVKLTADITGYVSNLKRAQMATSDFKGQIDKAGQKGNLDAVTGKAALLGAGLAGVALSAVKMAADFDKSMSSVSAATHASSGDMDKLRAAALQAGKDTNFSATQAADGITELSKAGVSTADVLNGGLSGALNLAAAGQLSVGEAAETAASAMTQFKLSGNQVPHVADLLAAAAGKAQGSVHDMGYALSQSGLVAAQFGLSIEDTTGALAEFASAGLIGSDAGTSLKTMLLALANPSSQTKDKMNELGISFYDAQGKFIGLSGVAQVLQTRLKGLTDAQRQQALGQIFGNDAIRAASVLYADGAAGVDAWKNKVNDAGYAAATAQKQTDNLAGDIERLKGSLETFAIQAGSGGNSGLRVLTKSLNGIVNQFVSMPPIVGEVMVALAALSGALLLGLVGWSKYRKGIVEVQEQLIATGPAGEKAAAGLTKATSAAGKAALAFVALEGAAAVLNQFGPKANDVDKLTASLTNFANTGKATGDAADLFGNSLDSLNKDAAVATSGAAKWSAKVAGVIPILGDTANAAINLGARIAGKDDYSTALQNFTNLDTALTSTMTQLGNARKSSDLWNQVLAKSGLSTQQLADLLPNTYKELSTLNSQTGAAGKSVNALGTAADGTANSTGDLKSALAAGASANKGYATSAQAAAAAARGERDALSDLSDKMKAESNPVFGLINAESDLTKAQKAAAAAVKQHGRNSDEAKTATQKLTQAAISLQSAAGSVAGSFNGKLSPAFMATLRAAGLTSGQIKDVQKQFVEAKKDADKYSGKYAADVSAPGAKDAKKQIDDAYTAANHFDGPYSADLKITGQGKVEAEFHKLSLAQQALKSAKTISGFAEGGWTGPGGTHEPAGIVHADEYVIQKSSRQSIESKAPGLLDHMNTTGSVPGYSAGGLVMPYPVNVAGTKIPNPMLTAPGGIGGNVAQGGGPGYKWMEAAVRAAFPGMGIYSDYRPGAITLTGNRSYHSVGRAVDFAPSKPLAEWINMHYMRQTKELITPWQSLNIRNGARHQYSALVENEHNFAGGNAHDHWAMANGGVISEPVFGIGASGRTYSFGENYQPERVTPMGHTGLGGGATINIHFSGPVGSQYQLKQWLTGAFNDLKRAGRV
jgi:TP901 family phage tail tape measure protein